MVEGLIGDLMDKEIKRKKTGDSRMWKEIVRVINLSDKEKEAYHRKVAIEMQQDYDRDTITYIRTIKKKYEDKKGKKKTKPESTEFLCKIRKNEDGALIMFVKDKTTIQFKKYWKTEIYNLVIDKDGYEHLVPRKEEIEENLDDVPF